TFDRDRVVGVLYRLVDGRAELLAGGPQPPRVAALFKQPAGAAAHATPAAPLAGGPPPRGVAALFKQPEGVVVDARGALLVADRAQGTVVRLDAQGEGLDARLVRMGRP